MRGIEMGELSENDVALLERLEQQALAYDQLWNDPAFLRLKELKLVDVYAAHSNSRGYKPDPDTVAINTQGQNYLNRYRYERDVIRKARLLSILALFLAALSLCWDVIQALTAG